MTPLIGRCGLWLLLLMLGGCAPMASIDSRLSRLDLGADTYIVRAGETLESIAFRYQIPKNELIALNPGVAQQPQVGTPINLRQRTPIASVPAVATSVVTEPPQSTLYNDRVITSPIVVPQAMKSQTASPYAAPQQSSVTDYHTNAPSDSLLLEDRATGPREVVEEVYVHQGETLTRNQVGQQLQSYVGQWSWPTQGQVARGFAPTTEGRHGIDIAGLPGQPVLAALDGTVLFTGKDPSGAGNIVIVKHDNDLLTAYSHTKDLYVAENDSVRAGDPIATLGANERQESVLRFEVRRNGNPLNPMDFLQEQ